MIFSLRWSLVMSPYFEVEVFIVFSSCSALSLKYKLHKAGVALHIICLECGIATDCTWYWCTCKMDCCTSVAALSFLKSQKIPTGRVECEFFPLFNIFLIVLGCFYSGTSIVLSMVNFRQSYVAVMGTQNTLLSIRLWCRTAYLHVKQIFFGVYSLKEGPNI